MGKELACDAGDTGDMFQSFCWEEEMAIHSNILAWKIPQRNLVGYSPWSPKGSDTTEWPSTHNIILIMIEVDAISISHSVFIN